MVRREAAGTVEVPYARLLVRNEEARAVIAAAITLVALAYLDHCAIGVPACVPIASKVTGFVKMYGLLLPPPGVASDLRRLPLMPPLFSKPLARLHPFPCVPGVAPPMLLRRARRGVFKLWQSIDLRT